MGVKWTDEQQQVIDHRGGDLLVSAAAGSGKTAVLVAHIMARLMDKEKPLDISRLLLVTFTEAAAAEMRDRLIQALDIAAEEDPDNADIAGQISRIPRAHIQTIDSFCMWLVRNNFHKLDVDPDFRIAEEGEGRLMRADVMDELLEEKYEEGSEEFLDLIDRYSRGKDDTAVSDLIMSMYSFSQSSPDPDRWLADCRSSVCVKADSLEAYPWAGLLSGQLRARIKEQAGFLSSAAARVKDYDCLESLRQVLEEEARSLLAICGEDDLDAMVSGMRAFKKGRLTHRKIHDDEPEGKEYIKRVQRAFGDEWDALKKGFAFTGPEEMCEVLREAGGPIVELTELTREFTRRYEMEKKEKNLADFSDVEHWALRLLKENEGLADELSLQFDEIAVDEYQDSNLIQEEILTAVSGARRGARNMLMVGDVKQSIYKFRMAKPELFMGKYDRYPRLNDKAAGMDKEPGNESGNGNSEGLIELSRNFRTRAEVLEAVNHVFFRIMRRELGGVEYTADCALYAGADFPALPEAGRPHDNNGGTAPVELMLTVCGQGQDRGETEARAVAEKIRRMTDLDEGLRLWDAKKGEFRVARYSDIAILMRRVHGSAAVFEETLRSCGIPAVSRQSTGYFDAVEVQVLLNALAVIDNPAQDIPLASVMLSPMSSFDEDDLAIAVAWYKGRRKNDGSVKDGAGAFYNAVKAYAEDGDDAALRDRLAEFIRKLNALREYAIHNTIYDLIGEILRETGYDLYLSALPAGNIRRLNVEMLRQKAAAFEKTSYHGIFQFNRYIDKLRKYDVDFGEAQTESDQDDVVRIMSIHKSKGLEYPVVFVCSCDAAFDNRDASRTVILQDELGAASDFIDIEKFQKRKSLWKALVADRIRRDNRGEELRVLYVAMTRAKEKLILSGVLKEKLNKEEDDLIADVRTKLKEAEELMEMDAEITDAGTACEKAAGITDLGTAAMTNIGEMRKAGCRAASEGGYDARKLPAWYIAGATSFLDWLLMAFGDAPELVPISIRRKEELEEEQFTRVGESGIIREALSAVPPAVGEPLARWESRLDRGYRYEKATEAKGIWTVSELKEEAGTKEKARVQEEAEPKEKAEPKEAGTKEEAVANEEAGAKEQAMVEAAGSHVKAAGKTGGAFRGTVYHRILQNMPPTSDVIAISAWIRQNLPADQAEMVDPDDIAGFYRSRSGSMCLKPGVKRHVEQPFVYGIPESRFIEGRSNGFADWNREPSDADNRLYDDEELILIQGTIDLYLEEEDGITLIDYKTDVASTERILAAYVVQLRCYAMALSHITGKKIKAIRIYSFHNKCEIEVK